MIRVTKKATEGSTLGLELEFYDDEDNPVTPSSQINWTMLDETGATVATGNVSAANPATIVLKGSDLAVADTDRKEVLHELKIETTYSSNLGAGLPFVEMVEIPIINAFDSP